MWCRRADAGLGGSFWSCVCDEEASLGLAMLPAAFCPFLLVISLVGYGARAPLVAFKLKFGCDSGV